MTTNEQIMAVLEVKFESLEQRMDDMIARQDTSNGHVAENARISRDNRTLLAGLEERMQDVEEDTQDIKELKRQRDRASGGFVVIGWAAQAFWAVALVWATLFINQRCSGPIPAPTATPTDTATPAMVTTAPPPHTATPTATVSPTLPPTVTVTPETTPTPTQICPDPPCMTAPPDVTPFGPTPDTVPRVSVVVQPGDTLYAIGRHCDVPWQEIAAYNQLEYPFRLEVGQIVDVPGVEVCE